MLKPVSLPKASACFVRRSVAGLLALSTLGWWLPPAAHANSVPLRVELAGGGAELVVSPVTNAGALFVWGAADLRTLTHNPVLVMQTNTPQTNGLRLPLPNVGGAGAQGYFTAARWSGPAPSLVAIAPGTFTMGSPATELGRFPWEGPQTEVSFTNHFLMGRFEVTQGEYRFMMTNRNPSYFSGDSNRPVEQVSWVSANEYCQRLTESQRAAGVLPPGWAYRLPTAAEWEYACRAGSTTPFHYGDALLSGMANFDGAYEWDAASGETYNPAGVRLWRTTAVGSYAPNAWGLCDMHGNVWEWCQDWYAGSLPGGTVVNPGGPSTGTDRVYRGGCWYNDGRFCRTAYRLRGLPTQRGNDLGFRLVLAPN
jgi:formylglycine-generating enzyme required for sulfatase activity